MMKIKRKNNKQNNIEIHKKATKSSNKMFEQI